MSQTTPHSPGLSRRGALASVLAATAAALPVMAAASPSGADAALLALCAEFQGIDSQIKALDAGTAFVFGSPDTIRFEAELGRLCGLQNDLMGRIIKTPAQAQSGLKAKADILLGILEGAFEAFHLEFESDEIQLVMSLLKDVTGGAEI